MPVSLIDCGGAVKARTKRKFYRNKAMSLRSASNVHTGGQLAQNPHYTHCPASADFEYRSFRKAQGRLFDDLKAGWVADTL